MHSNIVPLWNGSTLKITNICVPWWSFVHIWKHRKWVTCHNLLHKTIMMYILPRYKWYITKKVFLFQWFPQKNSMTSPSCSILMPWYAMAIQSRWNWLSSRLPILMGAKGLFHLVNLPNGELMFSLCIRMDGWIFWFWLCENS